MFVRTKNYFIGHRLIATEDVFEKAKINLVFNFTLFMTLLAIPFVIQLYINGFWYHFSINIFEILSLIFIYILFKTNISLKYIGISFVIMDSIMSAGSLVFQNGYFEIQAGLWSMLLIIYTFFVLGKKWGLSIVLFITFLYLGCVPFENGTSMLNFGIPENQILPTASAFIVFPFLLNIYIITVFINTNIAAENLMRKQKQKLETQKNEIVSSITYARRIQQAKLPKKEDVYSYFPNSFILFKPKDIVSGDFYWVDKVNDSIYFAAVDCTGHGVPGAMMSVLGFNLISQAVHEKGKTTPSEILGFLDWGVNKTLRQSDYGSKVKDGMDLALCCFNPNTLELQYAGVQNPLYIVTTGEKGIELLETKADKSPIGINSDGIIDIYTNHTFKLKKGDCVYIFSDGYADQMGGTKGKKFMYKPLRNLLTSIAHKEINEQLQIIENTFYQWKKDYDQVDDVLLIGVKI